MSTPSFGELLRRERESRNATIEEIAGKTKIRRGYLEALEDNEFDALPGRAFGKLYIRMYAELLGFDPRPLIDEYEREQRSTWREAADAPKPEAAPLRPVEAALARWREARREPVTAGLEEPGGDAHEHEEELEEADVVSRSGAERVETLPAVQSESPAAPPAEAEPSPIPIEEVHPAPVPMAEVEPLAVPHEEPHVPPTDAAWQPAPGSRRIGTAGVLVLLIVGGIVGGAWVYRALFSPSESGDEPVAEVAREHATPPEAVPPVVATPPQGPAASERVATPETVDVERATDGTLVGAPSAPAHLTVPEFGVGRDVVNRRLVGSAERFSEGSVVCFATRVLGGRPGQRIRHVWLRDGRPVQTIELELGGPHWRTHSRKTVWGVGPWAVEARDAAGRVLARSTFVCGPGDS